MTHNCAGIAPAVMPEDLAPLPKVFDPAYYLVLAWKIVRWDDAAIRRAASDPRALAYGAFFWLDAVLVIPVASFFFLALRLHLRFAAWMIPRVAFSLAWAIGSTAILTIVQIGLCHLIAKVFLKATGSFVKVLRPLLLGWFVNLLVLVPFAGPIAAAITWSAVLMLVFEEVDGIGRVPAFVIAYGVNMGLFVLQGLAVHYWLAGLR